MRQLTFTKKMILSAAVFAIPIVIFAFLTYRAQSGNIEFAAQERRGDTHQKPLMSILTHVGLHRVLAQRVLHGDKSAEEKLNENSARIDKDIAELIRSEEVFGEDLQFTADGLSKRKREGATAAHAKQL